MISPGENATKRDTAWWNTQYVLGLRLVYVAWALSDGPEWIIYCIHPATVPRISHHSM